MWEVASRSLVRVFKSGAGILTISIHPTRLLLASGDKEGRLRQWIITPTIKLSGTISPVSSMALSTNGRYLAAGFENNALQLWQIFGEKWKKVAELFPGDSSNENPFALGIKRQGVWGLYFVQKDQKLIVASVGKGIVRWDLTTRQPEATIYAPYEMGIIDRSLSVAISPDEKIIAYGDADDMRIEKTLQEDILRSVIDLYLVTSIAFSADNQFLVAIWQETFPLILYQQDDAKKRPIHHDISLAIKGRGFRAHSLPPFKGSLNNQEFAQHRAKWLISAIQFSKDNLWLVLGLYNGDIYQYAVADLLHVLTLTGHKNKIRALTFSPDSQWLASGSEDCTLRIWSTKTWKCVLVHSELLTKINCIQWQVNGEKNILTIGSQDGIIRSWEIATEEKQKIRLRQIWTSHASDTLVAHNANLSQCYGLENNIYNLFKQHGAVGKRAENKEGKSLTTENYLAARSKAMAIDIGKEIYNAFGQNYLISARQWTVSLVRKKIQKKKLPIKRLVVGFYED